MHCYPHVVLAFSSDASRRGVFACMSLLNKWCIIVVIRRKCLSCDKHCVAADLYLHFVTLCSHRHHVLWLRQGAVFITSQRWGMHE
jgi:hypothetical protein